MDSDNPSNPAIDVDDPNALNIDNIPLHLELVQKQIRLTEDLLQRPCDSSTMQVLQRQLSLLKEQEKLLLEAEAIARTQDNQH